MPHGSGLGLYPYGEVASAENDEVSSTYEGRHLTVLGTEIGSEMAGHSLQQKGHPLVVGEHIVGVAFNTEVAGGYVTFDTEGIWLLSVVATDQDGDNAVIAGDELFINKSDGIISKNNNKLTHTRFGYALGGVVVSQTAIISVKVHWCDDDEEELVGQSGAEFVSADASHRFREYHYEAQGGGYPHGDHLELTVTTLPCNSAQALVRKLLWTNATNLITGYCAVGEFELIVTGGAGTMDTTSVIHLTSNIGTLSATHVGNFAAGWIYIDEYATVQGEQLNNLFIINDTDTDYPYTTDSAALFSTSGAMTCNHSLRISVNGTPYWIMVASTWA